MAHEDDIRTLNEKAAEIRELTGKLEAKLKALPLKEETAPIRAALENMIGELRRMDRNIQAIARIDGGNAAEGGEKNGSH